MTSLTTKKGIKRLVTDQLYLSHLALKSLLTTDEISDFLKACSEYDEVKGIEQKIYELYREIIGQIGFDEMFGVYGVSDKNDKKN